MTPYAVLAECVFLQRSATTIIEELEAAGFVIAPKTDNLVQPTIDAALERYRYYFDYGSGEKALLAAYDVLTGQRTK